MFLSSGILMLLSSGVLPLLVLDCQCSQGFVLHVRDVVCLESIMNPSETIAKGIIQSTDPSIQVGGEELGPNWCEVSIQVAVNKDERLIRSYEFHRTIYDTYGATVAWPCPYVELENVDDIVTARGWRRGKGKHRQVVLLVGDRWWCNVVGR
ncbi:hypothetical protein RJ639_007370 [Escallonia herrerae]|uniref:Transposase Tnp1/En/Spm-like domain-containing protein n=1 Tax=Escallonia herrerae TaxID=1293975 RepID=A0AA88VW97_9ASTE|nr:hypothetical protein RJ639_007370 [Escallonia herrerae]